MKFHPPKPQFHEILQAYFRCAAAAISSSGRRNSQLKLWLLMSKEENRSKCMRNFAISALALAADVRDRRNESKSLCLRAT